MVCCFTGHRKIEPECMPALSLLLDHALDTLIHDGVTEFRTGGAVGFDTLAALKVLEKKEKNPDLKLALYLPCRNQTEGWDEKSKAFYMHILGQADNVIYVRDRYIAGCMLERNRRMVQGSQFCIGYCTRQKGGSAYTLSYARSHGLRVINLESFMT